MRKFILQNYLFLCNIFVKMICIFKYHNKHTLKSNAA